MENKLCRYCDNYRQHYVMDKRKIFRVNCGHCTIHISKRKKPDTAACEQFVNALPDEDAFVSREYLNKVLLQYVLNLDLLPPIEDLPE